MGWANQRIIRTLVRGPDEKDSSISNTHVEYADPYTNERSGLVNKAPTGLAATPFSKLIPDHKYPLEQRIQDKKRGIGRQKHPYVGTVPLELCQFLHTQKTW